jgi:hypothetical protein
MDTQHEIEIEIEYELNSGETGHLSLLPRDYFEPEAIEQAEALDVDAEPLHYDTASYLDANPEDLKWAKLNLRNKDSGRALAYNTSYWNHGKNQITAKTEWNEGVIVEEAITFSLTTSDNPATSHIVRTVANEGVHVPVYHRVFTAQADGEEKEDAIL